MDIARRQRMPEQNAMTGEVAVLPPDVEAGRKRPAEARDDVVRGPLQERITVAKGIERAVALGPDVEAEGA